MLISGRQRMIHTPSASCLLYQIDFAEIAQVGLPFLLYLRSSLMTLSSPSTWWHISRYWLCPCPYAQPCHRLALHRSFPIPRSFYLCSARAFTTCFRSASPWNFGHCVRVILRTWIGCGDSKFGQDYILGVNIERGDHGIKATAKRRQPYD